MPNTHSVPTATGKVGSAFTLTPNTIETVTFDKELTAVQIIGRDGAGEIWYTLNGSDPTVGGDHCFMLPAAVGSGQDPVSGNQGTPVGTVVKLISDGAPKVRVQKGS